MKLPNGYGSIYKKKGNRRKPYVVIVTTGWTSEGKQKRKILDYVVNVKEGLKVLANYHGNPYDLEFKNITFEMIWNDVIKELEESVENEKMSQSNLDGLNFAFKNHCRELYKEKIFDLTYKKMQNVIDNAVNTNSGEPLGVSAKGYIKSVCVKIFNYAIYQYDLPLKNNPAINLKCGAKTKSDKHVPFTEGEIATLWGLQHIELVKILLIYLYTGLRPNEIFITHKNNIHLSENYFITGSKTESGKDRIIPIHHKIKHLIKYFNDIDNDYPFATIFTKFNYGKFIRETNKLMRKLKFEHTPYDCRHTFVTKMKQVGANEFILKRIVGHSINDVTEKVYTHRQINEFLEEINKLK